MSKRLRWFVIFLVIFALAAITYFFRDYLFASYRPYDAIPQRSAMIFQLEQPEAQLSAIREDSIWRSLTNYDLVSRLNSGINILDSVFDHSGGAHLWKGTTLLAAVEKSSAADFSILYVIDGGDNDFEAAVQPEAEVRKYNGEHIRTYSYGHSRLHVVEKGNLLVCSTNDYHLEESIDQLNAGTSLLAVPEFEKARELSQKNKSPKCFIQLKEFPKLLSTVLSGSATAAAHRLMGELGSWIALDFTPLDSDLFVNGYLLAGEQQGLLTKIEEGSGFHSGITEVLPFNTALFVNLNAQSYDPLVANTPRATGARPLFDEYFVNWLGNNTGMGIVEPFSTGFESNIFLVAEAADTFLASKMMQELAARNIPETTVEPQDYKAFDIYRINDFDYLDACLGFGSRFMKDPYFVLLDNYVVFANSVSNLKVLIERYLEQETLDKDLDYLAFRDQMTRNASLTFFVNTSRSLHLLSSVASDTFRQRLEEDFSRVRALNPVGLQFSSFGKNTFLINGFIQSHSTFQEASGLVWKVELDSNPAYPPVVVKNHENESREIFTQDAHHQAYLINGGGEVLWKRQLDGPIVGEVRQVDFYRNGKLQYLFATTGSIHLIDRLGRYVENFPLRLPSKITSGLSVFDYNRNGKYRMFVGCENKNVYGFYKSGRPLPGWSPKKLADSVIHPIDHFVVDTRDHLMLLDETGTLSLLNRQAEDRLGPFELETAFAQPFYLEKGEGRNFELINCDEQGVMYRIVNGRRVETDTLTETFGRVVFRYHDITGDGHKEYILKDAFKLVAFDRNGEQVFDYSLPDAVEEDIFFVKAADETPMVGIYSRANELIYLVKPSGLLYDRFPLGGSTPFSVAPLMTRDEWLVITGMRDRTITTYRLK